MKIIIGIAGQSNSEKDTAASMINYIINKGITKAKYEEWIIKRKVYDSSIKDHIIHFEDSMKDCASIVFGIEREFLDERRYKDELWYCLKENRFIKEADLIPEIYKKLNVNDIIKYNIARYKQSTKYSYVIKLRALLQYFGTNMCRENISDTVWIDASMKKIDKIVYYHDYCIISDVRFTNEADAIHNNNYTGKILQIIRESKQIDSHENECINFKCDFIINNNGSLMNLFYNVLNFIQTCYMK